MHISDIRSTLYVLVTAIESDMRSFVKQLLVPICSDLSFLHSADLKKKISERFQSDFPGLNPADNRIDLVDFMDFPDSYHVLMASKELNISMKTELKKRANDFELIVSIRNRVMHGRPLMAGDFSKVISFAQDVSHMSSFKWSACTSTLIQLETDPTFAYGINIPVHELPDAPCHNLPMPDFDDTGFVGRSKDIVEIKRLLMSKNNVITLIGVGGIGKTALLIKVLYDMVDMGSRCPFDYIIWISTKTSSLTDSGIKEINSAVGSFEGVIGSIGESIGNPEATIETQQEQIIRSLSDVSALVVFDNLETIVGERINCFLKKLQEHAKIVITSRVGLGELEYRRVIEPLPKTHSLALLRELAHVRNCRMLYELDDKKLSHLIRGLNANPLAIKWFVNGVASGKTPGEVLSKKAELLEYCMSNVYEQMTIQEIDVLAGILVARRPIYEPEIVYYTDSKPLEVRKALNGLMATSFVTRSYPRAKDHEECQYDVTPLAREYLVKKYPPSKESIARVTKKKKELSGALTHNYAIEKSDPFSINLITVRNIGEQVSARGLQKALNMTRKGNLQEAVSTTEQVINSSPTFFEGYRIMAFIRAKQDNMLAADEEYKKAIELEPDNPRLLYFYAGFILRYLDDPEEALKYAKRALDIDPKCYATRQQYATCLGYTGRHVEAIKILEHTLHKQTSDLTAKTKKVLTTQIIDFCKRIVENAITVEKDIHKAYSALHKGMNLAKNAISDRLIDQRMIEKIAALMHEYYHVVKYENTEKSLNTYNHYLDVYKPILSISSFSCLFYPELLEPSTRENLEANGDKVILYGYVIECYQSREYAFIQTEQGERYFFHRSLLANINEWKGMKDGVMVQFQLGRNTRGVCAVAVECFPVNEL